MAEKEQAPNLIPENEVSYIRSEVVELKFKVVEQSGIVETPKQAPLGSDPAAPQSAPNDLSLQQRGGNPEPPAVQILTREIVLNLRLECMEIVGNEQATPDLSLIDYGALEPGSISPDIQSSLGIPNPPVFPGPPDFRVGESEEEEEEEGVDSDEWITEDEWSEHDRWELELGNHPSLWRDATQQQHVGQQQAPPGSDPAAPPQSAQPPQSPPPAQSAQPPQSAPSPQSTPPAQSPPPAQSAQPPQSAPSPQSPPPAQSASSPQSTTPPQSTPPAQSPPPAQSAQPPQSAPSPQSTPPPQSAPSLDLSLINYGALGPGSIFPDLRRSLGIPNPPDFSDDESEDEEEEEDEWDEWDDEAEWDAEDWWQPPPSPLGSDPSVQSDSSQQQHSGFSIIINVPLRETLDEDDPPSWERNTPVEVPSADQRTTRESRNPNSDAPVGPGPSTHGSTPNAPRTDGTNENDPQNPQPREQNPACFCFSLKFLWSRRDR